MIKLESISFVSRHGDVVILINRLPVEPVFWLDNWTNEIGVFYHGRQIGRIAIGHEIVDSVKKAMLDSRDVVISEISEIHAVRESLLVAGGDTC